MASEDFNLGKLVGEHLALMTERQRIKQLIEDLVISSFDPKTEETTLIEMDWTPLFDQIDNPEED
jgi:hypothetical protein